MNYFKIILNKIKMKHFNFFGIVFFPLCVGITVGFTIYGLSDIEVIDLSSVGFLIWKSTVKGMIIGAFLGLLNLLLRIGPYDKIKQKTNHLEK